MKVSKDMRLSWLQHWHSMDDDGSNLLDYTEFVQGCGLHDNMWSWRMFSMLDKHFVGVYPDRYIHLHCVDTRIRVDKSLSTYIRSNIRT